MIPSTEVKRLEREADHSSPSREEVKNRRAISEFPTCLHVVAILLLLENKQPNITNRPKCNKSGLAYRPRRGN